MKSMLWGQERRKVTIALFLFIGQICVALSLVFFFFFFFFFLALFEFSHQSSCGALSSGHVQFF